MKTSKHIGLLIATMVVLKGTSRRVTKAEEQSTST